MNISYYNNAVKITDRDVDRCEHEIRHIEYLIWRAKKNHSYLPISGYMNNLQEKQGELKRLQFQAAVVRRALKDHTEDLMKELPSLDEKHITQYKEFTCEQSPCVKK
jgi:hypothetical protein